MINDRKGIILQLLRDFFDIAAGKKSAVPPAGGSQTRNGQCANRKYVIFARNVTPLKISFAVSIPQRAKKGVAVFLNFLCEKRLFKVGGNIF